MKSAQDIVIHCLNNGIFKPDKIVEFAQKDAWNEAIEAAAESAKIEEWNSGAYRVNKESILKLKMK